MFFAQRQGAGRVRESKSPQSATTSCVRKPNDKWRIHHALDKLNVQTILAQTLFHRKWSSSTVYRLYTV
ncbi:hypothetical protein Plhal304r1_c057g0142621 [Plasmopara halstedii]